MWERRTIALGADEVALREAGAGAPLVIFHDELGPPAWSRWCADLASARRLIAIEAPGFCSPRLPWIRDMRDLASFEARVLRALGLERAHALGFSFGAWTAAEIAAKNPSAFASLTLVAPFGVRPPEGEIADMFLMTSAEYIRAGFASPESCEEFAALYGGKPPREQIEAWEDARVECAQIGWQPYMHDPALPPQLEGVGDLPALIIGGDADAIVHPSAYALYARVMPNAALRLLRGCGHRPELERRDALVDAVLAHAA